MITMDVKGITWVGCLYEKFESMCLEVEENMYEDTVKFVEDQVQTVGESVKKFYADVMQDLLCDSSFNQDDISACGYPVEHYSDVDNSKKSKIGKKKEHVKVGVEEVKEDSVVISSVLKDAEHTGLLHRQRVLDSCTKSSGNFSDMYSRQNPGFSSYNKKIGVKETPSKDRLPGANAAEEEDCSRVSLSCCEFSNEKRETACEQPHEVIIPSKSSEGLRCESMGESLVVANASQCSDDVSVYCQSSDMSGYCELDRKRGNELLESLIGGSNNSSMDAIASNTGIQGMGIVQQSDKAKLEEACVMVNGEELHFVHHTIANYKKPCKKKMPKAFTSRTSSGRKREYEQLALWHGHHTKSILEGGEDLKKSLAHDFCESEWEFL